jgi:hypothetical protein
MADPETARRAPRWRRLLAIVLLVLGCLLAPLSVAAVWVRGTLLDTDQYVDTVAPLASDVHVQATLAAAITNGLFERVDVQSKLEGVFPSRGDFLAAPLSGAIRTYTEQIAKRALGTAAFETLWRNANRTAHKQVVKVLTGNGRLVNDNGQVVIRVDKLAARIEQALSDRGIHLFDGVTLPPDKRQVVLFDSGDLRQAQGGVNLLQKVAWALPFLSVLCFAGYVLLRTDRRRALVRAALALALSVGLLLVLLALGRGIYLDAVSSPKLSRDTAAAVWDNVTHFLKLSGRSVLAFAVVFAIGAWLAGPGKQATRVRALARRGVESAGARADDAGIARGGIAAFVAKYRTVFTGAGVAIALLVLVVTDHPAPSLIVVVALVLLVYLGLVAVLARAETPARVS